MIRNILVGWLVILAIGAPIAIGYVIGGDQGTRAVGFGYVLVLLGIMFTILAAAIGSLIRDDG